MSGLDEERNITSAFNRETLPQIVAELSKVDGHTWTIAPLTQADIDNGAEWRNPVILGPDGERLHIRVGGYQNMGRIEVGGSFGDLPDGSQWFPHLNMSREHRSPTAGISMSKTPAQIAGDIKRRVLHAGYRFYMGEYRKRIAEQTAYCDTIQTVADRLIAASGGAFYIRPRYSRQEWEKSKRETSLTLDIHDKAESGISYGQIQVNGADSVRFELSMSPELAEEFAKAVAAKLGKS